MRGRLASVARPVAVGVLLASSLPPWGWWPLAFFGLVLADRAIADRDRRTRFARGWLVGMGLFVPSLWWMVDLTAPGYVIACVAYAAMLAGGIAAAPACAPGRWLALPGGIAVAELVRWSWPFGGVPLSSLAVGQVAGPLAPVLRLGGSWLLLEVTLLLGFALAAASARRAVPALVLGLAGVGLVVVGALAPDGSTTGSARVALVQGGGPQGTRAIDTDERVVFERHLRASADVVHPVDLVVWPEDVVDVEGPVTATREGGELEALANSLGAELVVGVTEGEPDGFRNAALLFDPDGTIVDRYEKVHRVPFGEYVPLRSLIERFAPDSLPERDAIVGDGPARLDSTLGRLSVAISWEIFFGDRVREGVEDGAALVLNPTNGSSFTGTQVQTQQVASSRMRALETGRWVLQVAPTGFSAVIDDRGDVVERSAISEARVLHRPVELREGTTLYVRWGLVPGWIVALGSLGAGWAVELTGRRSRRAAPVSPPRRPA